MQDQINVRDAVRDDVPILVQFNLKMAMETEDKQLDEQVLTSGMNSVFDDPNRGFYLVAEVAGKVVFSTGRFGFKVNFQKNLEYALKTAR